MSNETLKTWLDAMPIEEVRHRIERLEAKLSDLRVLERLYSERHEPPPPPDPPEAPAEPAEHPQQSWGEQQG